VNRKLILLGVLACVTPTLLHAQESAPARTESKSSQAKPAAASEDNEVEAVVITGERLRGAVIGDIPPEETLSAADVRSFGVSSMNELLSELSPQTTSGRGGSPVVLLNGRRISSFAEIRDIPTEAIQRVEILPEEVALKYGYSAEQKVVNIVLRQRFRANTGEVSLAGPTGGGQATEQVDASSLRLNRDGRANLAIKYQHSDSLLETDRDITNPSDDRTLLPKTQQLTANAVLNRVIGKVSATVNASASAAESISLLGAASGQLTVPAGNPFSTSSDDVILAVGQPGALDQNSRDLTGHLGFTLDSDIKSWRWSVTGNYDHAVNRTLTDRGVDITALQTLLDADDATFNPFASIPFRTDRAHSISDTGNVQAVFNGALFRLPAGDLSTTVKLGAEATRLDSESRRSGVETNSDLSRNNVNGQVSFDLPITSVKNDVLPVIGDLSANLNLALNHLSDFGSLTTIGYGLSWSPIKPISFIVSVTQQENAPTISQLGGPLVTTPDARVFDYVNGETVDVTRISGGNPDLKSEEKHVLKLGLTVKPASINGLSISANYFRTRIDNPIASFPSTTAAVEDAFLDRFTRDDGTLIRVDARPVNFAHQDSDQIRWGLNFSRQIGKTPPRPAFDPARFRQRDGAGPGQAGGGQAGSGQATTGQAAGKATAQAGDQPPGAELLQGALGGRGDQPRPPENTPTPTAPGSASGGERGGQGFGPGGPGGGPGGPGGPGGFGGPPGGFGATRLQLAFYHTIHLRERIQIQDGMPALDLLNGDAIGSSGGQPQHELEAQAGITKMGLGARLSANWRSATSVNGGTAGAPTNLHFGDLGTINLRLFANLGVQRDLVTAHPFLRGTRVTFGVTNILDSHMKVRDQTGATPVNYQPDYLDSLGRSVQISFRKLMF
jgi:hypothetical protein